MVESIAGREVGRSDFDILGEGQRVLNMQTVALGKLRLDGSFVAAVHLIADRGEGCVITTGVGKSGIVAQRIAATLTVTGTPSHYLHAGDAGHGDVGRLTASDTLLMVSRSGEGGDLLSVAYYAGNKDTPIILITASPRSALASEVNIVLEHDGEEACKYGLTPTTSVTLASVLGDCLCLALQQYRGFGAKEFAALHADGNLGRRLMLKVSTIMLPVGNVGFIRAEEGLVDVLVSLADNRGTVAVVPSPLSDRTLQGIVTAGDVARWVAQGHPIDPFMGKAQDIMTRLPKWLAPEALVVDAIGMMQEAGIMALPVLEEGKVVGMVHLHDALRARVQ